MITLKCEVLAYIMHLSSTSLRGRYLKGKGKGAFGARETRRGALLLPPSSRAPNLRSRPLPIIPLCSDRSLACPRGRKTGRITLGEFVTDMCIPGKGKIHSIIFNSKEMDGRIKNFVKSQTTTAETSPGFTAFPNP